MSTESQKTKLAIVCFFIGGLGVHRFMVGKTGTGKSQYLRNMYEHVREIHRAQWIDAREIQRSSRSCVASFCGILKDCIFGGTCELLLQL